MRVAVRVGDEQPVEIGSMDVVPAVGDVLVWRLWAHRHNGEALPTSRGIVKLRTFTQEPEVNHAPGFPVLGVTGVASPLEWVCTLTVEREA